MQTNSIIPTSCPCILVCSGKVLDKLSPPSLYQVNEETYLQTKINISDLLRACSIPLYVPLLLMWYAAKRTPSSTVAQFT